MNVQWTIFVANVGEGFVSLCFLCWMVRLASPGSCHPLFSIVLIFFSFVGWPAFFPRVLPPLVSQCLSTIFLCSMAWLPSQGLVPQLVSAPLVSRLVSQLGLGVRLPDALSPLVSQLISQFF